MKKAVIFDLNGVFVLSPRLSDRFRDVYGVASDVFLPVLNTIMQQVRMPNAHTLYTYWQPYLQQWGITMSEPEFMEFWFTAEKENPDMVTIARELKEKGVRLLVMSNNLAERAEYYKKEFPFLDELFEKVYYSWQVGYIKPDERYYQFVLRDSKLKPEDCIYFDDGIRNVEVAQSLGIESHLYENPQQVRQLLGL